MLEAKYFGKNCSSSRNVVFLLDTRASYTVISPALQRLILADCKIHQQIGSHERLTVKINGREILPRLAKDHYANTNILGMDYMKANAI
jgi:hypothetical protein